MGMAAIWLNGTEPFEQIVNILLTEGPMWDLVKIIQAFSEKKFKDFMISYLYIAQGHGHITPKILTFAKQFYFFNHML